MTPKLSKDQVLSMTRSVLICFAGFAMGHGIAAGTWDAFVGFAGAIAVMGWDVTAHDADLDQFLSVVRGGIATVGGYAIQRNWASTSDVATWTSVALAAAPVVWSYIAKWEPQIVAKDDTKMEQKK